MSRHLRHVRSSWGVAGALLISLALAGCGRTIDAGPIVSSATQSSEVIYTAAPTYTAASAYPLNWQARPLPTPLTDPNPAVSFSNTGTAWLCAPHGLAAQIWVTHDGAQHWQRVSDVSASGPVDSCSVVADEVDATTAVVQVARRQPGCCAIPDIPYPLAATHDGGKTWAQVNGPLAEMSQLASYHGVSFAVFHAPFADASPGVFAFAASSDGLHTWHRVDDALASHTQPSDPADARAVRNFWVNPATGELLVHSQTSWVWSDTFLTSRDGGATWHDLHAPIADQFLVRAPFAAGPWEICGLRTSSSSAQPSWPAPLICTLDSGKTWANRDDVSPRDNESFALANDGYALAGSPDGMYRSAPGKSAWESLGSPPTNDVYWYVYQPGAGSGMIWALQQTSATNAPPATQVYVASYA
jgi:photosystem II stability/assembly factor-like uncharacterized protein